MCRSTSVGGGKSPRLPRVAVHAGTLSCVLLSSTLHSHIVKPQGFLRRHVFDFLPVCLLVVRAELTTRSVVVIPCSLLPCSMDNYKNSVLFAEETQA